MVCMEVHSADISNCFAANFLIPAKSDEKHVHGRVNASPRTIKQRVTSRVSLYVCIERGQHLIANVSRFEQFIVTHENRHLAFVLVLPGGDQQ